MRTVTGYSKEMVEAMTDMVNRRLRMMEETFDPDLLDHVWQMTREKWHATARGDVHKLEDLEREAVLRLHAAGWLDEDSLA